MTEQLQSLLDRIQKEGVEKAQQEAERIVSEARARAASIVREAEDAAGATVRKAEQDAALFETRARTALAQAARDLLLSLSATIGSAFEALVRAQVDESLSGEALKQLLPTVVQHYLKQPEATTGGLDVVLGEKDSRRLRDYLLARFAAEIRKGLTFRADGGIVSGFTVSLKGGTVMHDFTTEAMTAAICHLVQPQIAAIVAEAVGAKRKDG